MNGQAPAQRPVLRPPVPQTSSLGASHHSAVLKSSWSSKSPLSVAGTTLIGWWYLACALINRHSTLGASVAVPSVLLPSLCLVFLLLRGLAALGLLTPAVPARSPAAAPMAPCFGPRPSRVPSLTWLPCLRWCCGGSTCVSPR